MKKNSYDRRKRSRSEALSKGESLKIVASDRKEDIISPLNQAVLKICNLFESTYSEIYFAKGIAKYQVKDDQKLKK